MGTFILDFQTIDFEPDAKVAIEMFSDNKRIGQVKTSFALAPPVQSLGWSFAKMFLAGQFVEKLYTHQAYNIEASKGRKPEDKFIAWLQNELKDRGCGAQIKIAPEMKSV